MCTEKQGQYKWENCPELKRQCTDRGKIVNKLHDTQYRQYI